MKESLTNTNGNGVTVMDVEEAVRSRYSAAAETMEPALCCPIEDYDGQYLKIIPEEILEKDYGCGDPSKYVNEGDTVVDLGSGGGKICYILSQKVGADGAVIGVDVNDTMLDLARKHQDDIAGKIGYSNVRFVKGKIQDLALDLNQAEEWLERRPITSMEDLAEFESFCSGLRQQMPMIPDGSVDAVVSNCVLNLVKPDDKEQLFDEIFRVLKKGGRAVISDIVSDEQPTEKIMNDPELWSGCISGAFTEHGFLEMFEKAGFYGVEILARQEEPWQVVDGIEFRSVTVRAYKGKEGPCLERNQSVVYKGPWSSVRDDDGHVMYRGQRMAVCDKTFKIMTDPNGPYHEEVIAIEPRVDIPLDEAGAFNCKSAAIRDPRQTKGQEYRETIEADGDACGPDGCC